MSNDTGQIIQTLLILVGMGAIVIGANYADRERSRSTRRAVVTALALTNILIVMLLGVPALLAVYTSNLVEADVTAPEAWGGFALALIVAGLGSAVLNQGVRDRLVRIFPKYRPGHGVGEPLPDAEAVAPRRELEPGQEGNPLFPQMLNYYTTQSAASPPRPQAVALTANPNSSDLRGFNPASTVHMVALAFVIYMLGVNLINFVIGGGLQGVADLYSEGLSAVSIIAGELPFLIIPVLGVGLGMRRTFARVLLRLGVTVPTGKSMVVGVVVAIGLLMMVGLFSLVWQNLVSEETFKKQTEASDALSQSIDSLFLAFLVAASAAIGEETAFRGALQPVFGLWPTAIIFALTHMQYTLTPAALIILIVALAFGWLRHRYNTTVTMTVHFVYNFIPLAIASGYGQQALHAFLAPFA